MSRGQKGEREMINRLLFSLFALLAAVLPLRAAAGQAPSTGAEARVLVVLADELDGGPGVSAVVLHRTASDPRDIILLRRADADGTRLASAVAMLMLQRESRSPVDRDAKTLLRGAAVPAAWRTHWLPRFESLVARLRRKDPEEVTGVGAVPAEALVLPPPSTTTSQ